jgi:hypothetical protein
MGYAPLKPRTTQGTVRGGTSSRFAPCNDLRNVSHHIQRSSKFDHQRCWRIDSTSFRQECIGAGDLVLQHLLRALFAFRSLVDRRPVVPEDKAINMLSLDKSDHSLRRIARDAGDSPNAMRPDRARRRARATLHRANPSLIHGTSG